MSASLKDYLKSGPPAPRVALLPDQRFFVRTIPVSAGTTAIDLAGQVELALEAMSPFPPAQLFYGYYWAPGSPHALVFSSYRKRFPADQVGEWGQTTLVMPAFAAFVAAEHKPATSLIYPTAEGFTAIHWDAGPVPVSVLTAPVAAEATPEDRAKVHDELLKSSGETLTVIDLPTPPEIAVSPSDAAFLFRAGEFETKLPVEASRTLDVRAPEDLAAYRASAKRDLILWRVTAGSVAALFLLGLAQIALSVGGNKMVLPAQKAKLAAQTPAVNEVMNKEAMAEQIEALSKDTLLPLEMLTVISSLPAKGQIQFTQMITNDSNLHLITVRGVTQAAGDVENYRIALEASPLIASAVVPQGGMSGGGGRGGTNFTMNITFKPDALTPAKKVAATTTP